MYAIRSYYAGKRGKGQGGDELFSRLGRDHGDKRLFLDQLTHPIRCLISGYGAGDLV